MPPLLVALALTIGAPALKDKPGPEPTLVGEWVPQTVTVNGNPSEPASDRWVFAADGTWALHVHGTKIGSGSFICDPKRSPGTTDLAHSSGGGPDMLCRYRLDGNTLVLSIGVDPGVRPADVQPTRNTVVWVLKRAPK
jgi:uncharacterized protein (TIGR03067 family)